MIAAANGVRAIRRGKAFVFEFRIIILPETVRWI
jgi:hypothetical protein